MKRIDIILIIVFLTIISYAFQVPNKVKDVSIQQNMEVINNQMLDKNSYDTDNDNIVDNSNYSTNGNPVGTILTYVSSTAPIGYLYCNGQAVSRTTYATLFAIIGESFGQGDNSTTFNLPDLRGQFLRGMDNGASRDPDDTTRTAMASGGNTGDNIGSIQTSTITAHTHAILELFGTGVGVGKYTLNNALNPNQQSGSTGGSETRPINVYVSYIIKY